MIPAMSKAELLFQSKHRFPDGAIMETKLWRVPQPVPGSKHSLKYRLYYGKDGVRLVGYDNERGKGDHRHIGPDEAPYRFVDIDTLLADFKRDILNARGEP